MGCGGEAGAADVAAPAAAVGANFGLSAEFIAVSSGDARARAGSTEVADMGPAEGEENEPDERRKGDETAAPAAAVEEAAEVAPASEERPTNRDCGAVGGREAEADDVADEEGAGDGDADGVEVGFFPIRILTMSSAGSGNTSSSGSLGRTHESSIPVC